jgi:hypothetical protein
MLETRRPQTTIVATGNRPSPAALARALRCLLDHAAEDAALLAWAREHTPEPRWLGSFGLSDTDREYLLRERAREGVQA